MTQRHLIAFLGLLSFLLGGCSKQSAPPNALSPDAPVLKVAVFADGRLTVDGAAATIQSLQASLHTLSEKHGGVCYYREASKQEPPPIAGDVMKAIVEARLPIRFSSRPDYSDSIGLEGRPSAGVVVFEVADVVLVPGEHWMEFRSELYASSRNTCLPVLKGEGEFKGVMIFVVADPTDRCSPDERATGLRKDYESNPQIVPGSLKGDKFTTDAGLAGVHLAFDEQKETSGKKTRSHNSIYIVQNARGVTVALFVIASGVGHEPTDLGSTDQMIRKTLRLSSRPEYSDSIEAKPANGYVADSDPEMAAAIAQAQATLPQFWQVFDTRAHGESGFLLVVRVADKGRIEHFVITDFERRDGRTMVTIRSDPKVVSSVKRGDRIEIPAEDITDWRYVRDGKEVGMRTAKVLLKRMPADQGQALKKVMTDPNGG
jgi:uncharacterized protein YegJ (DUF2314 family)